VQYFEIVAAACLYRLPFPDPGIDVVVALPRLPSRPPFTCMLDALTARMLLANEMTTPIQRILSLRFPPMFSRNRNS